jgi:ATP-dependent Clp protease protease subunit
MSQFMPYVIERTANGERAYDLPSRLLQDRIVFLNGPVNENVSHSVVAQMLFLASENPNEDINFYINSPGGVVTAGMAILDTMYWIKPDVRTVVMGQACSMGSFLANAGAAGKRQVLKHSRTMIHQPSGGAQGMASDIEISYREIERMKRELTEIYVKHNTKGKTYEEFAEAMDRDRWLNAQEAVNWGLADEVIGR